MTVHVVTSDHELSFVRIPDREREHPVQFAYEVGTLLFVQVHHDFGVGRAAELVAASLQ